MNSRQKRGLLIVPLFVIVLALVLFGNIALTLKILYLIEPEVIFKELSEIRKALICIPLIPISLGPSLVIVNCILYSILPVRRWLDNDVKSRGAPGFFEANRQLFKGTVVLTVIFLPITLIGLFNPLGLI